MFDLTVFIGLSNKLLSCAKNELWCCVIFERVYMGELVYFGTSGSKYLIPLLDERA